MMRMLPRIPGGQVTPLNGIGNTRFDDRDGHDDVA